MQKGKKNGYGHNLFPIPDTGDYAFGFGFFFAIVVTSLQKALGMHELHPYL